VQAFAEPEAAHDLAIDEAFERLYRSYVRDVYRYTLAVLRNPADAEDITQTTFLNAYRAYLRGEEPGRPRHWLIKIAHNACRSRHLRAVRRPQEVPFEETVAAIPVRAEETPKVQDLLDALGRLPFNQRAALVMRELEGRTYAEIADTLEVSVAAVETLIFRARRTLRRDRSLVGVLSSVQLPPSLASFFGGGGGGAVAGGGLAVGSGLLAKAMFLVAAGVVAGALGPVVDASVAGHGTPAGIVLSPLTAPPTARVETVAAPVGIRTLRGPIVVVTRQGRTFVVTEGVVGIRAAAPFDRGSGLWSSTAGGAQSPAGGTLVDGAPGAVAPASDTTGAPAPAAVASGVASASSSGAAAATETTEAAATSATTQVTQTAAGATQTASAPPVSAPPVSAPPVPVPTATVPPAPAPPVATPALPVALPPTPTVPPLPVP
jgi:RNA polymerase sigma factor (sigma-70 family)